MYLVCLNQQHFVTRGEHQMCHRPIKLEEGLHLVLRLLDDEGVYHTILWTARQTRSQCLPKYRPHLTSAKSRLMDGCLPLCESAISGYIQDALLPLTQTTFNHVLH